MYKCCQIHEYGHVRNGHRMLATHIHNVEHRNLEIRKHNDLFVQVRNLFITFELKVSTQRERQSFYVGFFIWPLSRAAPMPRKFLSPQRAPKVEPPRSASSFNSLNFSSKSPKSSASFRCVTSRALRHPFHHLRLLWHLWVTRPPRMRVTPASSYHPTNPCAEPKGSQPN